MKLREEKLSHLSTTDYDVLIVGGGINGAVAAASLSARGAKVALIDKGDFAGATSSNSSNLAWGGIKYLESHEYLLVNKLCKSRNHLMRSYPSTVKEIRFLTTIQRGFRYPPFMVFLGTILYWIMGRFFTQKPAFLTRAQLKKREPIIDTSHAAGGFEYSDCYLYDNDSRFVFNFIRAALNSGCDAVNYVQSLGSERIDDRWVTEVKNNLSGERMTIRSKLLINACGPYVDRQNKLSEQDTEHKHVFSKGIHLIVDRLTEQERVLAFFASDGRLFFVIPMGNKTCIGTTDTQVPSPETHVTEQDRQFVLDNVNAMLSLEKPLTRDDIISERCGVRPLAVEDTDSTADWVQLSRKHEIDVDAEDQHLSIFGGKLTDCVNVGDEIADTAEQLGISLPNRDALWYGEPDQHSHQQFLQKAEAINLDSFTPAICPEPLSKRLWRRYGNRAIDLLTAIEKDKRMAELQIENAHYLLCELVHMAEHEMITKLEDFLRRRSKIEMVMTRDQILNAKGLQQACEILFGDQAKEKLQEYRNQPASAAMTKEPS